jgi:hypothetical protein
LVPGCIPLRGVSHRMAVAVHLDHELRSGAVEVDCAAWKRVLPAKLEPVWPLAQHLP